MQIQVVMNKILFSVIVFSLFFLSLSCNEKSDSAMPKYTLDGDFNTKLFKAVLNQSAADENVIISPISVSTVTKMILAGSEGNTEQEILSAYGKNTTKSSLLADSESFIEWLQTRNGQPTIELSNAFFYDKNNFHPLDGYKQNLIEYFNATEFPEDFSDKEAALAKLNGWVSDKTNKRIPKILENITDDEVMFLVNALYLKADWADGFEPDLTQEGDFALENGATSKVDFMYSDRSYSYYGDDNLEAIALPYKDNEIAMYFIKSKTRAISDVISTFNFSKFETIVNNMQSQRYMAYIPKFTIEYKNEAVAEALKEMGIKQAFIDGADLSLMAEVKNMFVTRVIHKTFLTIDEKGTEGAAVTVGGIGVTSLPPTIRFDSPFMIVLADKASNNILFMGRISNPK
jgi:serpin B